MKSEDLTISYTSDTAYFEKLSNYHKDADILIASVIRPGNDSINGHMCTGNFKDLVGEVKPKLAIMTHFGFKMLNEDPILEAKLVKEETGIPTLAAFDGMQVNINNKDPKDFKVSTLKIDDSPNRNFNDIFTSGKSRGRQNS